MAGTLGNYGSTEKSQEHWEAGALESHRSTRSTGKPQEHRGTAGALGRETTGAQGSCRSTRSTRSTGKHRSIGELQEHWEATGALRLQMCTTVLGIGTVLKDHWCDVSDLYICFQG